MLTGKDIRIARIIAGVGQQNLAVKANISLSLMSAIETEQRRLTERAKARILNGLGMKEDDIKQLVNLVAGCPSNQVILSY